MMDKIPLSFYQHDDVVDLAKSLIGKYLFTCLGDEKVITGGIIIETEAYNGAEDKASHAYRNLRTKRTETMFSAGGVAYVYLCYGIHHLLNIVTNQKGIPHAVLIRAIKPEIGIDLMVKRRHQKKLSLLTNGPGALCQALGITKVHDGCKLDSSYIWLEDRGIKIFPKQIETSPRIGVNYAEEDALKPWRFTLKKN